MKPTRTNELTLRARDLGYASGRDAYKFDLLRFLGAQPRKGEES